MFLWKGIKALAKPIATIGKNVFLPGLKALGLGVASKAISRGS